MYKYENRISRESVRRLLESNLELLKSRLLKLNDAARCDLLFVATLDNKLTAASSVIVISGKKRIDNFQYDLEGSPCHRVLTGKACAIPNNVSEAYPNDDALKNIAAQGYIGVPIFDSQGQSVAILVGIYQRPEPKSPDFLYIFELVAENTGQLIERTFFESKSRSRLALLKEVEQISDTGAWEYHVSTDNLYWSEEVYSIHALTPQIQITTDSAMAFYTEDARPKIKVAFYQALKSGAPYSLELTIVDAKGEKKWVRTSGKVVKNQRGDVERVYGAIEDITAEKTLLFDATQKSTRLQSILDNLNDAVITINTSGIIEHTNAVALDMFGYTDSELKGQNVKILMPEPYASKHDQYLHHYALTGKAKIIGVGRQLPGKRKNGEVFQMELSLTKAVCNEQTEYIGIIRDISERIKARDTIYNLAYTDSISGLKNKRWLEKECKDLLARAKVQGHYIYAALIDIDKMAQFNLQHGFENGDRAIKQIAMALSENIARGSRLYKNGADSFVLLNLSTRTKVHSDEFNCQKVESALLNKTNFVVRLGENTFSMSASLGSCICEAANHNFETIMDTLEHALRQAKQKKPLGAFFVDEAGLLAYERFKRIRQLLDTVTQSGELNIVLQPQYNSDGNIKASEALIRWQSAELGFVSPADFIPIAEETNDIIEIGDWVLEQVCEVLTETQKKGIETRIAVNISGKQIVAPDFERKLIKLIQRYNVSPASLMLELTETTLVSDIELVKQVMGSITEKGFQFSIDDFGTGYSSLSYLKELPISELKIDKYFVDDILARNDHSAGKIVNLVIDMAKALGVQCVAEGVETVQQVDFLSHRGCDLYQGYYFSKPLNKDDWHRHITDAAFALAQT